MTDVRDEGIVLDHAGVAANRTALDITNYIDQRGPDFGDAAISAYMSSGTYGSTPVDFTVPNRTITIPLGIHGRTGGDTFDQVRTKLQAKVALFQREGGWVARTNTRVGTVYAKVVNASLKLGGSSLAAYGLQDTDAVLTLECLPDWYGDEVSASPAHSETALPDIVWTETGIEGDYPGPVRIVVTETNGIDQLALLWGFRSRHYSSATTAKLAYEAEALTPLDAAAVATLSAASGGASNNTMQHSSLGADWTGVLGTNLLSDGSYLTHTGSYRVWARVYSTSGSSVQVRFAYDVGDMTNPTINDAWTFPAASKFYLADLGEMRLDTTTGTHRWSGAIQAKGASGGESVRVDRLYFQPLDEGAGVLTAPQVTVPGLVTYSARDEFNQSAGALAGKTAAVGGTWAGAGDTDDFAVETTGKTAQRTAVSDADANTGRYAISGVTAFAAQAVQADAKYSAVNGSVTLGVIARYTDTNNWLMATVVADSSANTTTRTVKKRVSGTVTTLGTSVESGYLPASTWFSLGLVANADGVWAMYAWLPGGEITPILSGQDSVLATSGTLATGKPGIYDANTSATANTRNYDNFRAWPLPRDAVAFANQSVEITTDGVFREDSGGAAYGPVTRVTGDLPRIPVAGVEGRTVETFVLTSCGNLDDVADFAITDKTGQIYYRPSWLYLPDDTGS